MLTPDDQRARDTLEAARTLLQHKFNWTSGQFMRTDEFGFAQFCGIGAVAVMLGHQVNRHYIIHCADDESGRMLRAIYDLLAAHTMEYYGCNPMKLNDRYRLGSRRKAVLRAFEAVIQDLDWSIARHQEHHIEPCRSSAKQRASRHA